MREQEASSALAQTRADYLSAMGAQPDLIEVPEIANPTAAAEIRAEYAKRYAEVAAEHEGTVAATLAAIEQASLSSAGDRGDEAIALLEQAVEKAPASGAVRGIVIAPARAALRGRRSLGRGGRPSRSGGGEARGLSAAPMGVRPRRALSRDGGRRGSCRPGLSTTASTVRPPTCPLSDDQPCAASRAARRRRVARPGSGPRIRAKCKRAADRASLSVTFVCIFVTGAWILPMFCFGETMLKRQQQSRLRGFLALAALVAPAASAAPDEVVLRPRYQVGDRYALALSTETKTRVEARGTARNKFREQVELRYAAQVEVLATDDAGSPVRERHENVDLTYLRPEGTQSLFAKGASFELTRRTDGTVEIRFRGERVEAKIEKIVGDLLAHQSEYAIAALLDPGRPVAVGERWELDPERVREFLRARGIRAVELDGGATAELGAGEGDQLALRYRIPIRGFALPDLPPGATPRVPKAASMAKSSSTAADSTGRAPTAPRSRSDSLVRWTRRPADAPRPGSSAGRNPSISAPRC